MTVIRFQNCSEHRATLWLHAEPQLSDALYRSVLAPLLAESPNSRQILADTLLAWLQTRGSAPALAAKLGKHPQTIRYRLRRLHELFGASLEDDDRCFEMYVSLRAHASQP